MAHLRTEIAKIFDEIDKDLQNNKENSMTIYDCFDFQKEDKDKFIDAIYHLIDDGVMIEKDGKLLYSEICNDFIDTIISCNPTLAIMIIEKLNDREFIPAWSFCREICYLIDRKHREYIKQNPPTPLEKIAKDFPYLSELVKAFNKKV